MGATRALAADSAGAAMDATAAAMQEVEQRMRDPLRKFCLWRRVRRPLQGRAACHMSPHPHFACGRCGRKLVEQRLVVCRPVITRILYMTVAVPVPRRMLFPAFADAGCQRQAEPAWKGMNTCHRGCGQCTCCASARACREWACHPALQQ
jgi:hypothetical protein